MATLSITPAPANDISVSVNATDVTLSQGTTLNVEVTPTPATTVVVDRGVTGASGISGYSGYSGAGGSGASGISGYSGFSGFSGIGTSGYSGFSGAQGSSGISGASGISGFSGYSGAGGGTLTYDEFNATASQTTFTTSATYTSGKIQVSVNGVIMDNGTDVTVTSGTQVVFATGLTLNDRVFLIYPA
jgi:hypothetical protein